MNAALLSIGDELALGQILDTNAPWLADQLARQGGLAKLHLTVPDDLQATVEALRLAARSAPLVIATGGLGPTDDDLTRQALSQLLASPLILHRPSLKAIERFFAHRGREMPSRNRAQALYPRGSRILANPVGTAPGILARYRGSTLFFFPGVPHEMQTMFDRHVRPWLRKTHQRRPRYLLTALLHTFGTGESVIADILGDLMDRQQNPLVGTTVSQGIISIRIRSEFSSRQEAGRQLAATVKQVKQKLGDLIFGQDHQTLQESVARLLMRQGTTVATAESCTGGLLGKLLTDVPGSSDYFLRGWITYSNESKTKDLKVPRRLIVSRGAVSREVAQAMAQGVMNEAGSDFALAITGIAGPTGGSKTKPVGTVWIALAQHRRPTLTERSLFPGDRSTIRDRAAKTALNMLRLRLLEQR